MPYITKEQVAAKRAALKKALPNFKLSVRNRDYSKIDVAIMSGPIEMTQDPRGYEQVNHFWIDSHYEDRPEIKEVLNTINRICKEDQRELVYDGDYGSVPTFYVGISIGQWDRPYEVKKPRAKKTRVTKETKYAEGYLPKIQYWTNRMQQEASKGNLAGVEFASKKVAYFMSRQEKVYGK
jgi:hypothetical protein